MFCVCFVPTLFCSTVHTGDPSCPETRCRKVFVSGIHSSWLSSAAWVQSFLVHQVPPMHRLMEPALFHNCKQEPGWLYEQDLGESRARGIEQSAHNCPFLLMLSQLYLGLPAFTQLAGRESCGALDSSAVGFV